MFVLKEWYAGIITISTDDVQKALDNGLSKKQVYVRITQLGWSADRAVNTPVLLKKPCCYTDEDVLEAASNGISWNTFRLRIHNSKWSIEKAKTVPTRPRTDKNKKGVVS